MKNFFNIFDYSGKTRRKEYWLNFLFYSLFLTLRFSLQFFVFKYCNVVLDIFIGASSFSVLIDMFFLLKLCSLHIRLINACGKKLWNFFIPFYNLYFLFCKPQENTFEPKKRYGLIPLFIITNFLIGFFFYIFSVALSTTIIQSINKRNQIKQQEIYKKQAEETKKEIERKTSGFIIQDKNEENYDFARQMQDLYYFMTINFDSTSPDENIIYYGKNFTNLRGVPNINLVDNTLLTNSSVQIGDPVEKIYSLFGGLTYYLHEKNDSVSYIVYIPIDNNTYTECDISFDIIDKKIVSINGTFEDISYLEASED